MRKIILSFCFLFAISLHAQELQKFYNDAMSAYKAKDYSKFYENIKEAYKLRPTHQGILYQFGIAAALTDHNKEAIDNLKKAILIDADFKLEGLADFNSIKDTKEFKDLLVLQKEWQTPLVHSEIAFVIKDRSLHTEGIEYDAAHKTFYLGSIHKRKIIKVSSDGTATDFCSSGFNGMTSIFGIKVDTKRNILWACSSPMAEMENYDSTSRSAVFKFEMSSGKLIHKYEAPLIAKTNVFGDLILNKNGQVFISDSQGNSILTVNEKTNRIESFYSSPDFLNIQGLAFSTDEKYLFIADYRKGIYRLEIKTKELIDIQIEVDASLKGIDGIYFYNNSLIAIQNGVNPLRCTRYLLNKDLSRITKLEIIDRKHPNFGEPTLGVLDGKIFYYIANSQWRGYDDKHQIKANDQLQDIVILKVQLK
jgi:sugar lactone lactonase YvrE